MNRSSQLFLLRELVRRDFSQRYAGSLFGFAWSFIHP
ncbi:MAG: ABC transporter permease, partial [Gemmatimonadetes bacterium]|nr:ABC transporter permease [Gemmatimonadota bacterium]NIT68202.1 ABC transporter permease [Gemmatimonadota bacterium]NIV24828.1 ABC transporter permease [Gemmatimonadota bacterium]NIW76777.1 ABC transporter permease [Gemmatimonadota bacterium]NIY36779.1 ABC transporter permease [Gemmatimonadota bacterium]